LRKGFGGSLAIVEPHASLGRGLAYSTPFDEHLLNVPAGKMSAIPDQPSHFLDWLRMRGNGQAAPGSFVPRKVYGEYLEDLLQTAIAASAYPAGVRQISSEAIAIRVHGAVAEVELGGGDTIEAERVVLAIGNPASSSSLDVQITELDGLFHPSPWIGDALRLRSPEERVLLIGSGLTGVDAALTLLSQHASSKVWVVSRRGLLPQIHATCLPAPFADSRIPSGSILSILRELRAQIEPLQAAGLCWRHSIDGLRPASNQIWNNLSPKDRRAFLRHLRPYWESYRHRMAPSIASRIHEYRDRGRLDVIAGRVRKFAHTGDAIQVHISRSSCTEQQLTVDRVINCTGIQESYTRSPRRLVRQLIHDGLASANELGVGFRTDPDGALIDSRGAASEILFTLGPPRRGELFETTAVPEIRVQAEALASLLLGA
jgi:uncharacterized NAD(P)/FAD-binding protein YdhS